MRKGNHLAGAPRCSGINGTGNWEQRGKETAGLMADAAIAATSANCRKGSRLAVLGRWGAQSPPSRSGVVVKIMKRLRY